MPQPMYRSESDSSSSPVVGKQEAASEAGQKLQECAESQQAVDTGSVGAAGASSAGRSSNSSEAQREADRLYEERMEDEYAKREGGA
jgi:hypothetical protein